MNSSKSHPKNTSAQPIFAELGLREELLRNLKSLDYAQMTPIQAQALPMSINNEDIIAQAKTGSGKTAAFGLTVLNKLNVDDYHVQALIVCPTRELADQVSNSLRRYARLMHNVKILNLSGGMSMQVQRESLNHSAHIVVGTPGRLQKHLEMGSLDIRRLQTLVLDEADRMLDMGFYDDIEAIIAQCPKMRQTLLFSATYTEEIRQLAKQFMRAAKEIIIKEPEEKHDIEQRFFRVSGNDSKFALLKSILMHHRPESTLIFCNTKQQTTELRDLLLQNGFSVAALNGDMEQSERDVAMIRFANKSCMILVATDVAARGLDIKELPAVVNYDLAFEHDVHIHRIGRTGRAGSMGLAFSFCAPNDNERTRTIESNLGSSINWGTVEEFKAGVGKPQLPKMITLGFTSGKRDKIRPGDILGALTKEAGLPGDAIGKINITPNYSYVAVERAQAKKAFQHFQQGKLKGRKVRVHEVDGKY